MVVDNQKKEAKQKNVERSVAYPAVTLEVAIELVSKLRSALGKTPYSREEAAKALGYSGISGASARAVAALVHYGLLDRNGNTYSTSELAEEIIHPTDETGLSKKQAIAKAALAPKLFDRLVDKFRNQSLPGLLENILLREGVSSNSAKDVAIIFKETLQFAGMLVNGVVVDSFSGPGVSDRAGQDNLVNENKANSNLYNFLDQTDLLSKKQEPKKNFVFTDSGSGWNLVVNSDKPLTSEVKKALIDIADSLKNINIEI